VAPVKPVANLASLHPLRLAMADEHAQWRKQGEMESPQRSVEARCDVATTGTTGTK
jgi:hypothetical protein